MSLFVDTPGTFANPAGAAPASDHTTYAARFALGRKVEIDKDQTHTGIITQVCFRASGPPEYEVCTWVEGREQRTWLEEFRLCLA